MENNKNGAGCCGKPLIRIALHVALIAAHKQDVTKIMINEGRVHLISSYSCCCCVKSRIRSLFDLSQASRFTSLTLYLF